MATSEVAGVRPGLFTKELKTDVVFMARQAHLLNVVADLDSKAQPYTHHDANKIAQWSPELLNEFRSGWDAVTLIASEAAGKLPAPILGRWGTGPAANRAMRKAHALDLNPGVAQVMETQVITSDTVDFMRIPGQAISPRLPEFDAQWVLLTTALSKPTAKPIQDVLQGAMASLGLAERPAQRDQLTVAQTDRLKGLGLDLDHLEAAEKKMLGIVSHQVAIVKDQQAVLDGDTILTAIGNDYSPTELLIAARSLEVRYPTMRKLGIRNALMAIPPEKIIPAAISAAQNPRPETTMSLENRVMLDLTVMGMIQRDSLSANWVAMMDVLQFQLSATDTVDAYYTAARGAAATLMVNNGGPDVDAPIRLLATHHADVTRVAPTVREFDPNAGKIRSLVTELEQRIA
jgi:hypothetical protein